jgi:ferritin-like metal-binding protein YciE
MTEKISRKAFTTLEGHLFRGEEILVALPKMAKAAQFEQFRAAFQKHEREAEEHVSMMASQVLPRAASPTSLRHRHPHCGG